MVIEEPTENDILCGKDKTYSKHRGNIIFRDKIISMTCEYRNASSKPARMKLTKIIVESLKMEYNARFLRSIESESNNNDDGDGVTWEEISDQQARDKTSHALRFALKKLDLQQTKSTSRKRRQYRRRSIQTFATTSTCSNASISSNTTHGKISLSPISARKVSSAPPVRKRGTMTKKRSASSSAPIRKSTRQLSLRPTSSYDTSSSSSSSSDESDAVSTTMMLSFAEGDDDSDASQIIHDSIEILFGGRNQEDIILNHHPRYYHHHVSDSAITCTVTCNHRQGVRSSPARLGGGGDNNRYLCNDEWSRPVEVPSGWMNDQEDMPICDEDLDEFLNEEIDVDWDDNRDATITNNDDKGTIRFEV